jgi:hypothetical protein
MLLIGWLDKFRGKQGDCVLVSPVDIPHVFVSFRLEAAMKPKPERKADDPAQYKRFLEASRKAEADETREGADRAFKKVTAKHSKESRRPSDR